MFARLKKKIENEGGMVPAISESAGKSTGLRDSMTSLPRAGSIQHLGYSPPGSITDDNISMQDESLSKDEVVYLFHKKSEQCKKLEGNISDLAALVKEKSKTVEKLETALRQQEENAEKELMDMREEFVKDRDKLTETHRSDQLKLEKLLKTEADLKACLSELMTKTRQCQAAESQVESLTNEVGPLKLDVVKLESEIDRLKEENRERGELVFSLSKDRATFERRLNEMNKSAEEKQSQIFQLQTQLSDLKEEHNNLVGACEQQRNVTGKLLQEKDDHIDSLQERVQTLKSRLSDFSLSGDDQLTALQTERDLIDKKLSETRLQLSEVRSTMTDKVSHLENQVSQLNTALVESAEKLAASHRTNDHMKESFHKQIDDLRNRLEEAEKRALDNFELATAKDAQYNKQIGDYENVLSKQKAQALNSDANLRVMVTSLDKQIIELETCRKIEQEEAKSRINYLEEQAGMFADKEAQNEGQVRDLKVTVNKLQEGVLEKISEISSLQQQIYDRDGTDKDQNDKIEALQQQLSQRTLEYDKISNLKEDLEKRLQILKEENGHLLEGSQDLSKQVQSLKSVNSDLKLELGRMMTLKSETEGTLREKLESLEQMIKQNKISETESGLHSEKMEEMTKTIFSLQTQLAEKNKTVKKQEQTLKDLRVTLQRELKVQLLPNDEGMDLTHSNNSTNSPTVSRTSGSSSQPQGSRILDSQKHQEFKQYLHQHNYRQPSLTYATTVTTTTAAVLSVHSSSPSMVTLTASSSSVPSGSMDALTLHTDRVKRELDKDINFLYLKHVVLKFMLSRESEAMHLIKAVSMLLNFTLHEQQLIRDTLEYKMSWFGHRPSVGEGQTSKIIPPAV